MTLPSNKIVRAGGLVVAVLFVGFIAIQFIRPRLTNPPVLADLTAPADVKRILVTSCYDCHSNETKLKWFDQIEPGYYLVVRDVRRGRLHLNFSNFEKLSPAQKEGFLHESVSMMKLGYMPPRKYTLLHPEATVSGAQIKTLEDYLHPPTTINATEPDQIAVADAEYQMWIAGDGTKLAQNVKPSLNGLTFPADYKNWKLVSTTDRFDNDTHRIILGNDAALKAIAAQQTHPWPDGAAFAKISLAQQHDDQGASRAGHFVQVEFMIKDAQKYASTDGWGFGRWKTTGLAPYGKTPNFATECVSCHAPMAANDHVYTMPIHAPSASSDVFNSLAALPDSIPNAPLGMKVITTMTDTKAGTMSTLFGNDLAITQARTSPQGTYPAGAVLALVTWKQQDDPHWFGARIPGEVQSVEFVTATADPNGPPNYSYETYSGSPLAKQASVDEVAKQARLDVILAARSVVLP